MTQPILIFSYGNPSRGDDAIGPSLHDHLLTQPISGTDTLTDFQLQIEHSEDLHHRDAVIFVDASMASLPPYEFYPIQPAQEYGYTTHAMSPQAVLSVFTQANHLPPPTAYMLSIRGYEFELGKPLSSTAQDNLTYAIKFLMDITCYPTSQWSKHMRINDKISAN